MPDGLHRATGRSLPEITAYALGHSLFGFVFATIVWFAGRGASNVRIKAPSTFVKWAAIIVYLVGVFIGAYFAALALYVGYYALSTGAFMNGGANAAVLMLDIAAIYWLGARTISYALGQ